MASEADFSGLEVTDRAVELVFRPTGDRLSFARFGTLLSPARPISAANFGNYPAWEVEWLARKLAQDALLRLGSSTPRRRPTARGAAEPPHLKLQGELGQAIERNELSLCYQGTFNVETRAIVGQETLLRWNHPQRGEVPPSEFIPLAEGSGDIDAIGRWVLDHAVAEAVTWEQPWRLAVNLSPVQFRQADLVDTVRAVLARHGLPANRLMLEITEGVLIDDTSRALTMLRALKHLGVGLALDDFGTGYSNLTYLRVLPLDRLKIDKSFIQDLGTSPQAGAITLAIIAMGKALGLGVTAEGVETEEQLAFLRVHGCDEAQGFLLGRPQPGPVGRRLSAGTAPGGVPGGAAPGGRDTPGGPMPDQAAAACP
jgi:EAL domain-containing protein (putative c-di-GMP-specific phosphodiesterase class I)